jgi:hypothetical protein
MLSWVSISNLASGHPIGRWDWVLGKNRLQSDLASFPKKASVFSNQIANQKASFSKKNYWYFFSGKLPVEPMKKPYYPCVRPPLVRYSFPVFRQHFLLA